MSWRQIVRSMEAGQRRSERAAMRHHRDLQRQYRELDRQAKVDAKADEARRAANEVEQYESYLELLVSVHKDCGTPWNWLAVTAEPAPVAPERNATSEHAAAHAAAEYRPGVLENIFGGAKKQRASLAAAVETARLQDDVTHAEALAAHRSKVTEWDYRRRLAAGVTGLDLSAFLEALTYAAPYEEVTTFGTKVKANIEQPDLVGLECTITDDELVPTEEVKLTASGKLSSKQMAMGKYWALYQDHVCACAIRLARETFGVLPVRRVIVNIGRQQMNTSTGHLEPVVLLGVHFIREKLESLNMDSLDPSDSMRNFPCKMKFKKTSGFEPVERITADEQWVTT